MRTNSLYLICLTFIISCNTSEKMDLDGDTSSGHTIQDSIHVSPLLITKLDPSLAPFYHGVASGDPTQNAVIIWTRVTLNNSIPEVVVNWEMSLTPDFIPLQSSGTQKTSKDKDYTVKIDVDGLEPGTKYYFRFRYNDFESIIGKTKTLPTETDHMKIAFASCSNYEWGFFNAYGVMANDKDLDLIVHLGDYIYEYGIGDYGDTTLGRINAPSGEIVSLQDYRTRYSLYRLDKDLMRAHQNKAFITTWDDHEIANNAYMNGAENHQDSLEGEWETRKEAGIKAYYEWLPVRAPIDKLYRSFEIGNLLNLIILDTRIAGRTEQVEDQGNENYKHASRTIIGQEQYKWLSKQLTQSQQWKIIGNQVPFGPMIVPTEEGAHPYMDGWDGYPSERNRLIEFMVANKVENTVIMTGDYHSSFALGTPGTDSKSLDVAVEFVVPSINSANYDEYTDSATVIRAAEGYAKYNPHIRYCNLTDHGYVNLTIHKDHVITDFIYVKTVRSQSLEYSTAASFLVPLGASSMMKL